MDAQWPQTCLASAQDLRSQRVSSASKSPDCVVAHRSDPPVRLVRCYCTSVFGSSVFALLINQGTQRFLVNHRKPRKLGVAFANRHSWLGSHVVPTRPWFWGLTKKRSLTSSCCSWHHVVCTWPRWPPGPSNEAYLSSPHLEASPTMTFHACSSPAPTPVKPQPAPAILSQESVHTTLSITHHTRKRPSTGPRTTHGPQSPPWWVHWQHTHIVTREKRKEMNKKKLQQATESQRKAKRKITWIR
jgi:hypothetical protein